MVRLNTKRGDTLIEVLFAVAIFSAVAVGAMVIMNQSITTAQTSLELTQVRNEMDSQAELLRHLNAVSLISSARTTAAGGTSIDGPLKEWQKITRGDGVTPKLVNPRATDFNGISQPSDCNITHIRSLASPFAQPFFINRDTGKVNSTLANFAVPGTYAQLREDMGTGQSEMIWIEAVHNPGATVEGKDKLRSSALGNPALSTFYDFHIRACWTGPDGKTLMKLGTIVRLYEPAT